ncbi:MAG: hypothetical protein V3V48_00645 [Candidatus Aminicenantaceae bacterium]
MADRLNYKRAAGIGIETMADTGNSNLKEKVKCPYCGSVKIRERVAMRYGDYDKSYAVYRCLGCGREFSEKDLGGTKS